MVLTRRFSTRPPLLTRRGPFGFPAALPEISLMKGFPPGMRASRLRGCLAWLGIFFTLAILAGGQLPATTLRPLNLEELTRKAGTIVVGRCTAVEQVGHPRHRTPMTKVTIRVDRSLKGRSGKTLIFRMASQAGSGASDSGAVGVPRFRPDEDLILFLYPESRSGLTSPVGLGQGKFTRVKGKDGREIAVNEFSNRPLFRDFSPGAAKKLGRGARGRDKGGPVPSSELVQWVEALVR